uniref:Flavodoxin-like domain-containing protein n=1 Tax=Amphimedon queenslandica TaxID=400682 RepID=A0A1X7SXZ1_AMPQE
MASSHDGESSYFSYLDVFLLGAFILVLFLIVRKFRRRARGDDERVKKLQINPVIKQISSPVYSSSLSTSGSFIDKMKTRKKRVLILYGSQTGTGEEFSNRLAKDSSRLGLPAMTFDPEDCTDWVHCIEGVASSSILEDWESSHSIRQMKSMTARGFGLLSSRYN